MSQYRTIETFNGQTLRAGAEVLVRIDSSPDAGDWYPARVGQVDDDGPLGFVLIVTNPQDGLWNGSGTSVYAGGLAFADAATDPATDLPNQRWMFPPT